MYAHPGVGTLLVIVTMTAQIHCYPDGQNVDSACDNLKPVHGGTAPRTSAPGYKLTFSPSTYAPGKSVKVTISSCTTAGYKGFMLQARRADQGQDQAVRIGSFTTVTNTRQACSSQALVHSSKDPKTTQTFTWNPPASAAGHLQFRVTFVQSEFTFWTNIVSDVLYDESLNVSTTTNNLSPVTTLSAACDSGTPQTAADTAMSVTKDSECGKTKGCFSSCENTDCSFSVSWQVVSNNTGVYTLTTVIDSYSYATLGFSSDNSMGSDDVMGCAVGTNNTVIITALNNGKNPSPYTDSQIIMTSGKYEDGVLTCVITRPLTAGAKRYNIKNAWTLFFVRGPATITNGAVDMQYHGEDYYISELAVTVYSLVDMAPIAMAEPLVKAHGCLMVAAWIFLASIGIIMARHYKPVWTETMCSQKVWFQVHRITMVLVLLVTAAGFIIIFVNEKGEWSVIEDEDKYLSGHPIMGVIVMILTILNPIMALFRPKPGTSKRVIFNWAHMLAGLATHMLGVATIFFGVRLQSSATPYYAIYILAAYVAWQLFVELLLGLINYCGKKKEEKEVYEMNNKPTEPQKDTVESHKISTIKKIILLAHCVIVAGLAAAVIGVISVGFVGGD
ncbi:unnamed protein product [Lymnaea stagnalis]|uniref:Ferric-chelate reductase 1 n=1 Tax=Lymnaea stagnalis TaxID=6523 RepID=A0AAV2HET5_LYMST